MYSERVKPSRFAAASSLLCSSLVTRCRSVLERRLLAGFGGRPPVRFVIMVIVAQKLNRVKEEPEDDEQSFVAKTIRKRSRPLISSGAIYKLKLPCCEEFRPGRWGT